MEIYMETPFYGVPRLTAELKRRGYKVNHKRVRRLQKSLNLRTVYPRPRFNTSEPHPEHEKFPYLLRKCKIERPNQVWSTDITYTAVAGHRAFVIGIVDWFSRKVLAYNVVNTMDAFETGDFQFGSREPVYQFGVRGGTSEPWHSDQHGRTGTVFG